MAVRAVCVCAGVGGGGAHFYKVVRNHLKTNFLSCAEMLPVKSTRKKASCPKTGVRWKNILRIDVEKKNHRKIKQ